MELLSEYSGYHKKHIEKIIRGAFAPKGAQNERISEKQPIKIEPEILMLVLNTNIPSREPKPSSRIYLYQLIRTQTELFSGFFSVKLSSIGH
ncbi:MAG: hypothetical protein QXQ64_04090 [Candidatus Bathyarchaeia archaeon]